MNKLLAIGAVAALVAACAAPPTGVASDPMQGGKGSTETGASKAEAMGFHGPVDRRKAAIDGPN